MKKTVIKRRKRVPANPGGSPTAQDRMTDQAAAEVLASVGRSHGASGSVQPGTEDSAEEAEGQPRRKRARKSKAEKDGEGMDVDDDEDGGRGSSSARVPVRRGTGRARRGSSRDSNAPHGWDSHQNAVHPSHGGEPGPSARPPSAFGSDSERYGAGAPRGHPFAQNPHGGFDLPPLNAAIAGSSAMNETAKAALRELGVAQPPSYVRAGSAAAGFVGAPSRTHSPLAGPGINPGNPGGYVLPPPHSLAHPYAHPPASSFYLPPPHVGGQPMGSSEVSPIPTPADLERHYSLLGDEKRRRNINNISLIANHLSINIVSSRSTHRASSHIISSTVTSH
ncbi:hypothetical protein EW026_g3873 [Hermanssonia centrifuga]|uniref:Uncharacterized protein n=1 Tax=Hermanssonia centrifuga TaxID=98765 RepID=A0A4S4KIW7_9APHY|nr:hypothetical protein EW026_g3873 [Hermanssonia centrifuga]